jgi:hypothetical protein
MCSNIPNRPPEAGEFDVVVTARVTGEAYGAFFTPDGVPYEKVVPSEAPTSPVVW